MLGQNRAVGQLSRSCASYPGLVQTQYPARRCRPPPISARKEAKSRTKSATFTHTLHRCTAGLYKRSVGESVDKTLMLMCGFTGLSQDGSSCNGRHDLAIDTAETASLYRLSCSLQQLLSLESADKGSAGCKGAKHECEQ